MKILHINASYKPAYIYGGPTVSVAKLCEEIGFGSAQPGIGSAKPDIGSAQFDIDSTNPSSDCAQPEIDSAKPDIGSAQSDIDSANPSSDCAQLESDCAKSDIDSAQASIVSRQNIEVTVYTTLANGKEELPYKNGEIKIVDGVEVQYFKRITKDHSHLSPSLLRHTWKTLKQFDIVHIHAWWNLVSVGVALICILKGKRYILSPRGTLGSYSFYNRKSTLKRLFHFLIGKPLLERAIFQVSSEKEKRDIENILGANCQIANIPNFVELKKAWERDWNVELQNVRAELLFFSRIEEKKGLEFLLNACALLNIPYHLTIAGSGEKNYISDLESLGTQLGVDQKITWLGQVSSESKFDVLAKYDLLILPSYDENFANVVIESLACGTPVLLSQNVGLADYVVEKELGWLVEQNAGLIAQKIASIFENKEGFKALRKKAKETIQHDFAEDVLRKSYIQFYQSII
jgi:glycosyltransferase involved in cell wall biosynthesis